MAWWKRTKQREFIDIQEKKKDWRPRINYTWIVRHLPYIIFLFVLATIYIANGHYAVKNIRQIDELQTEVKELHWDYLDYKSELMFKSKMNEVSELVKPSGLKIEQTPPLLIPEQQKRR